MAEPYSNDKLNEVEGQGYVPQTEGTACVQKTYFFLKKYNVLDKVGQMWLEWSGGVEQM